MNKKDRRNSQILTHGLNLKRIFNLDEIGPVTLCKKVYRLENKAHRMAEAYCNGLIESDEWLEKKENSIMKSLDNILGYKAKNIPVFMNGDPRGYALKINDEYVKQNNLEIYRDWGGYGIIAPEFDGII